MKASLLSSLLPFFVSIVFASASDSYSTAALKVRRERNLDHLDVFTLSYYLGIDNDFVLQTDRTYVGHDVAVMFYAQRDEKSRRFAPYWDSIATHVKAGSKESNIIMALFNCELDATHLKLCKAVGVTSYPTMMFIGAGPYPDQALVGKSKDSTPLPHTVKFLGNWQYGDAVLDWVHAMQGISSWHQWGWIKRFRRGLLGVFRKQKNTVAGTLPVGLPVLGGGAVSSAQLSLLEQKLQVKDEESDSYKQMATHASLLVDSILFPPSKSDPFSVLTETKGWNNTVDPISLVLRGCSIEVSLDYCARLSSHVTSDWLDNVYNASDKYPNYLEIDETLRKSVETKEPFCGIFDSCLSDNFMKEQCRPSKCPFQQDVACRYLTSCFDKTIQQEYAIALNIIKKGEAFPPTVPSANAKKTTDTKATGSGGWGWSA